MSWFREFLKTKLDKLKQNEEKYLIGKIPKSILRIPNTVTVESYSYEPDIDDNSSATAIPKVSKAQSIWTSINTESDSMSNKDEFIVNDLKDRPKVARSKDPTEVQENIKALEKLKSMPRGMENTDSKVAAVMELLGEAEALDTIRKIRWPHGVVCPSCQSTNIIKLEHKNKSNGAAYHYECLDCKGKGNPSNFDDLSGMPDDIKMFATRKLILCWYLMGCCSISQIARELGFNIHQVTKMISFLHNESIMAEQRGDLSLDDKKEEEEKKRKYNNDTGTKAQATMQYNELDLQSRLRRRVQKEDIPDQNRNKNKF